MYCWFNSSIIAERAIITILARAGRASVSAGRIMCCSPVAPEVGSHRSFTANDDQKQAQPKLRNAQSQQSPKDHEPVGNPAGF